MADAVVSLVLKRLAPLIEERVRSEVNLVIHSKEEVQKLADILKEIQKVLKDAEKQGVKDDKVRSWLKELEDVSYEIDDTLDEWEYKNLALQIEALNKGPPQEFWEKVSSFIESLCLCFNDVLERRNILLSVKELKKRLDSIAERSKKEYEFLPNLGGIDDDTTKFKRDDSLPIIDVSEIHGRESDKERLIESLVRFDEGLWTISVEGAGGMGKTALAQLVFNDEKVKDHFEVKIWVCVSDPFDKVKIAGKILKGINPKSSESEQKEYGALLEDIQLSISGKKFLLVLDDVWTEDDTQWNPLRISLKNGADGSVILVTTRSEKVSRAMGAIERHVLHEVSDVDCWLILRQMAFQGRSGSECEKLEGVGRKVVEKCKGLPLAAKTLGGLLRNKNTVEEWNAVLQSEIWELEIAELKIFPHLYLSYNELPSATKRCFSYCAVFSKDWEINVGELIRIWMAQGLLSSSRGVEMELRGREYFGDLAMRSFFQDFERDEFGEQIISCKMHDIVHDFARFITKHEFFVGETMDGVLNIENESIRHVWCGDATNFKSGNLHLCFNKLRSFFCVRKFVTELVHLLRRVRILFLWDCGISDVPMEIGNLIHLRYLNLSHNHLEELPKALFELYNLQTLVLQGCQLKEIPREIRNLIHLRYLNLSGSRHLEALPETLCDLHDLRTLDISICQNLSGLPQGISKLTNLQSISNEYTNGLLSQGLEKLTNLRNLNYLCVGRDSSNLRWLRNLNQLCGSLEIRLSDLHTEISDAEKAELQNKTGLQKLTLWCGCTNHVIDALQPHAKLQSLMIYGLLPSWTTSIINLRFLEIGACLDLKYLPALGTLPVLEGLHMYMLLGLEYVGPEFLGITERDSDKLLVGFPKLKTLSFKDCSSWEVWEDRLKDGNDNEDVIVSVMPCLERLKILSCESLKVLPTCLLQSAPKLKEFKTNSSYLADYYKKATGRFAVLLSEDDLLDLL